MAVEQDQPAFQEPSDHRRPRVEVVQPDQRPGHVYKSAVPSSSAGASMTSARIQRAGAPTASDRRPASSSIRGLKSMPTTSSAPGSTATTCLVRPALQVDGAPAATAQVADERFLDGKQVAPARADQLDRLGQPALVAFRSLVPRRAVCAVHPGRVRAFSVGCGTDVVSSARGSCMSARV